MIWFVLPTLVLLLPNTLPLHGILESDEAHSLTVLLPSKANPAGCLEKVDVAIERAFSLAGWGRLDKEYGFAVFADGNGGLATTAVTGGEAGAWRAAVPSAVIAIFHTHKTATSPLPSDIDRQEADRLQVPYYVISSMGLWLYEPDPLRKGKGRTSQVRRSVEPTARMRHTLENSSTAVAPTYTPRSCDDRMSQVPLPARK